MEISSLAINPVTEVEGIWKHLDVDTRVKVARANNPAYRELFRTKVEPYDEAIKNKILDEDTSKAIMIEVMAETILMDWEGITENGKSLPCTKKNKIRLLTEVEAFRNIVAKVADEQENYRVKADAVEEKNSSADSSGT